MAALFNDGAVAALHRVGIDPEASAVRLVRWFGGRALRWVNGAGRLRLAMLTTPEAVDLLEGGEWDLVEDPRGFSTSWYRDGGLSVHERLRLSVQGPETHFV